MAAGLGFKTFTTGEVLTAADTNGYLMQGINVFANASARTAAITSPQEGQYSYLKDTNALEYYDGAAWVGAPVGDITAVTAGKGLTGGGSSGDVTVSLATTAKGDLVAGSGASTAAVLTVGANNTVLTADSTAATGLKWAATSSGSVTLITSQSFTTQSTINVNNCFSSTYQNYIVQIIVSNTSAASDAFMRLRASGTDASGNDYKWASIFNHSVTASPSGAASNSASAWSDYFIGYDSGGKVALTATIFRPFEAASTFITSQAVSSPLNAYMYNYARSGVHSLTNAYDGFSLSVNSGTITGNLRVFGLANS